jgi:amidohydrolase
MQRRVTEIAESVAKGMDGSAEVRWEPNGYPVTVNDPALTERLVPTLARVVEGSSGRLLQGPRSTAGEDFSYFGQAAPGFFFWVGVAAPGADLARNPPNHSPRFLVEESGLLTGLRATLHLVADFTGSAVG